MTRVCRSNLNDPCVKGHVPIVTLYAVIMFKGHVPSLSEWTFNSVEIHALYRRTNVMSPVERGNLHMICNFELNFLSFKMTPY